MALSDDQRAMLRLLAQREQGYEDLAALMGLSVDEVRVKVKDALEAMEDGETPPPLPPEPAEPPAIAIEPEKPAAPRQPEPEQAAVEEPVETEPPPPPKAPAPKPAAPRAKRAPSSPPRLSMPSGQGARAAIAAGVAVVVLVIVVLVVSGGGSGSDTTTSPVSSSTPAETASEEGQTTPTSSNAKVTQAVLSAVDGSDASGTAVFGRVKNSLALQVEAEGLEPTKKGQAYTIWVAQSPRKMLPLASTAVGKTGKIGAQFEVPTEVLAYLANETFGQIAVTQTSNSLLKASLAKATKEKKAPIYTGDEVLNGPITGPIVGAAKKSKK